jgi:predicted nucleic acid-binding protein
VTYWDTSALFKLYVPEGDSSYFLNLATESGEALATSSITAVEILCGAHRKECAGMIRKGAANAALERFLSDCREGRLMAVPYGEDVIAAAKEVARLAFRGLLPVTVRALDAIHVASAMAVRADVMVATDLRLRAVADLVKLKLLPLRQP